MVDTEYQGRKPTWLMLVNPIKIARHLWRYRDLIMQMTRREIGQRYRGSYLGIGWSLIVPVMMLGIYTLVFSGIFHSQWRSDTPASTGEYALTLFAGLSAFSLLSEVITRSPNLVLNYPNFVKKVVFPLEVLPLVQLGSAIVNCLISQALLVIASIGLLGSVSSTLWLLPFAYVPLLAFVMAIGWLLASLGVYIRDIGQGISVFAQILLFVSPVMYPMTVVPTAYQPFFLLNPMVTILDGFRRVLLWSQPLDWISWSGWSLAAMITACLSFAWFMKTKAGFADVM